MSTHRHIDRLCTAAVVLALLVTLFFMNGEALGIRAAASTMGYEDRLFDTSSVHTIDIVMDDWEGFLSTCESEEYSLCTVVIDGESFSNVGIRGKGNTSLSSVSSMDSDRYSFKIEFDQYDSTKSYHGLDKLSLNNLIQDNTLMKDYLVYQMMNEFGVAAPLCGYVYITVNGEDWGLYLAVEGVEDSFLRRNYGNDHGELYKPDSMDMGGGRGNGRDFNMEDFDGRSSDFSSAPPGGGQMPSPGGNRGFGGGMPEQSNMGGMGSSDVKLQYVGDDPGSYSSIFGNAKTDITDADQTRLIQALEALSEGENIGSVVDVDAVLRYFVVHNYVVNGDSYTGSMVHNYYLYENDGLLSMIPWDYNLAFGGFQGGQASAAVNDPIDSPLSVSGDGDRPMADWIFADGEYTALYHQYFREFLDTVDIGGLIDQASDLISPYVEKDPGKFCTYEEFQTGVATLREFCSLRRDSVSGQLDGSIPSTDEGQSADTTALMDASHITLSDMGSMGMGGGGMPAMGNMDSGFDPSAVPPSGRTPPGGGQMAPPVQAGSGESDSASISPGGMGLPEALPGKPGGSLPTAPSSNTGAVFSGLIPLTVSAAVLLLGLFIAVKYRR